MSRRKQSNPAKIGDATEQPLLSKGGTNHENNLDNNQTIMSNVSPQMTSTNNVDILYQSSSPDSNLVLKDNGKLSNDNVLPSEGNNSDCNKDVLTNEKNMENDVNREATDNEEETDDLPDDSAASCSESDDQRHTHALSPAPDSCQSCSRSDEIGTPEESNISGPGTNVSNNGSRHECTVCLKTFGQSSILNKHIQTHSDHLEYSCSFCPRHFLHKRSRDRHIKLHTGDKKFKCNVCEATFARSDHLKIHIKIHENGIGGDEQSSKYGKIDKSESSDSVTTSLDFIDNHIQPTLRNHNSSEPSPSNESQASYLPLNNYHPTYTTQTNPLSINNHPETILPDLDEVTACCMYCRKSFPNLKTMYQHISTEHRLLLNSLSLQHNQLIGENSALNLNHLETAHWNNSNYNLDFSTQNNKLLNKPTDLSSRKRALNESDFRQSKPHDKHSKKSLTYSDSNDKPCICSYCNIQVPNFKSFLIHMETHVSVKTPALSNSSVLKRFCPICGEPGQQDVVQFCNHVFTHAISSTPGRCCHHCKKSFDLYENLQKHLYEKHSQTAYKCSLCSNAYFDTKVALQSHFTSQHVDDCKHYKCNICPDLIFHDKTSAEHHVSSKHNLKSYHNGVVASLFKCALCQKSFPDEYLRHLHHLKDHNDLYKLPIIHNTKFSCDKCPSTVCEAFSSADELTAHNKLHHSNKPKSSSDSVSLQCAYCNENCKSRHELESHMKTHHVSCSTSKDKHKCNICDEIFSSAMTLAEHKLTHCKIVSGSNCSQCKVELNDEETFYNHQIQHNNAISKSNQQVNLPANCIICSQTLQTNIEIRLHAKFHLFSVKQDFVCEICKKRCDLQIGMPQSTICRMCAFKNGGNLNSIDEKNNFNEPDNLQIQNQLNRNFLIDQTQQLRCYICSFVCTSALKLQSHMQEHSILNRLYDCNSCNRKFYFEADLENHMYIHKTENLYSSTLNYNSHRESKDILLVTDKENHVVEVSPKEEPIDYQNHSQSSLNSDEKNLVNNVGSEVKFKEELCSNDEIVNEYNHKMNTELIPMENETLHER